MFPAYTHTRTHTYPSYRASECRAHGSLGIIYELLKDTNKAIDHHQKVSQYIHTHIHACMHLLVSYVTYSITRVLLM